MNIDTLLAMFDMKYSLIAATLLFCKIVIKWDIAYTPMKIEPEQPLYTQEHIEDMYQQNFNLRD
jgi:hypothetical protein